LVNGYFADGLHVVVEDRLEESPSADAFPDPAPGSADIDDFRVAVHRIYTADTPAGRGGSNLARPKVAKQVFDRYLSGQWPKEGRKPQADNPFHGEYAFSGKSGLLRGRYSGKKNHF